MNRPASHLIVALDTSSLREAVRLARQLQDLVRYVKIGSVLFTAEGPRAIRQLRALGFEVFLDLKFHDIPSTVEKSCRAAVVHQPCMLTVHAGGGDAMLKAAVVGAHEEAARRRIAPPRVVAVTVLTSDGAATSAHQIARRVDTLAAHAKAAGCDGVVASVREAAAIRRRIRRPFLLVCPGIRAPGEATGDQVRVASPHEAIRAGADFLVVGRPVTQARHPREAARQLIHQMRSR